MKNHFPKASKLLAFLFLLSLLYSSCQSNGNLISSRFESPVNREIISEDGDLILVGQLNRKAWEKKAYQDWFMREYQAYQLNEALLSDIQPVIESFDILVFLGTWCSDSRREVPRFYKIMDYLSFNEDQLHVIALDNHTDRYKQSPQHEEIGWEIEFVPTIILLRDGIEIGRITESPILTLEEDLWTILRRIEA